MQRLFFERGRLGGALDTPSCHTTHVSVDQSKIQTPIYLQFCHVYSSN